MKHDGDGLDNDDRILLAGCGCVNDSDNDGCKSATIPTSALTSKENLML